MRHDLLRENPIRFIRAATDFLEIKPLQRVENRKINMGYALRRNGDYWLPVVEPLGNLADQVIPRFSQSDLEDLLERFKKDIARTEKIIDIDLSS